MSILKKIFGFIINPFTALLSITFTDNLAKFFSKRSFLIPIVALLIVAVVVLIVYRHFIF